MNFSNTQVNSNETDIPIHLPVLLTGLFTFVALNIALPLSPLIAEHAAINKSNSFFIEEQEVVSAPSEWDPTLALILENEVARLGITNQNWPEVVEAFMSFTEQIESQGKQKAYNPSGAMSYYQFKGESLKTAYVRLGNYLYRHDLGRTPQWSKNLKNSPKTLFNTNKRKQQVFLIVNLIEQDREKGTAFFERMLEGDLTYAKTVYYKYHHTAPDPITIKLTEISYDKHLAILD